MHDDYNKYDGFWAGYCDDHRMLGPKVDFDVGYIFGLIARLEERITELETPRDS